MGDRGLPSDFGRRMAAGRIYAGLSQTALGRELGKSIGWVKARESGQQRSDGLEARALLVRLCEITNLPEAFFTGASETDPILEQLERQSREIAELRERITLLTTLIAFPDSRDRIEERLTLVLASALGERSEPGSKRRQANGPGSRR